MPGPGVGPSISLGRLRGHRDISTPSSPHERDISTKECLDRRRGRKREAAVSTARAASHSKLSPPSSETDGGINQTRASREKNLLVLANWNDPAPCSRTSRPPPLSSSTSSLDRIQGTKPSRSCASGKANPVLTLHLEERAASVDARVDCNDGEECRRKEQGSRRAAAAEGSSHRGF